MEYEKSFLNARSRGVCSILIGIVISLGIAHAAGGAPALTSTYRSMESICMGAPCHENDLKEDWLGEIDYNYSISELIKKRIDSLSSIKRTNVRLTTDIRIAVSDEEGNLLYVSDGCVIDDIRGKKLRVLTADVLRLLAPVGASLKAVRCDASNTPIRPVLSSGSLDSLLEDL